jgi:hypothetical protein
VGEDISCATNQFLHFQNMFDNHEFMALNVDGAFQIRAIGQQLEFFG